MGQRVVDGHGGEPVGHDGEDVGLDEGPLQVHLGEGGDDGRQHGELPHCGGATGQGELPVLPGSLAHVGDQAGDGVVVVVDNLDIGV